MKTFKPPRLTIRGFFVLKILHKFLSYKLTLHRTLKSEIVLLFFSKFFCQATFKKLRLSNILKRKYPTLAGVMIFKIRFLQSIFFAAVIHLYSCNCVVRTYAPFTESTPALEKGGEIQPGASLNLTRAEFHLSAAPVNHFVATVTTGARTTLNGRWSTTNVSGGLGYFGKLPGNVGFEIIAGAGKVKFQNLQDTLDCRSFSNNSTLRKTVHTDITYQSIYIKPDLWFNAGSSKFILSLGIKQLFTPHHNYYVQEFREYQHGAPVEIIRTTQYYGSAKILLMEPGFQYRYGSRFCVYGDIRAVYVLKERIARFVHFESPGSVLSLGILYIFNKKIPVQPRQEEINP